MQSIRFAVRLLGVAALSALVFTLAPAPRDRRAGRRSRRRYQGARPGEPRPHLQGLRRLLSVRGRRVDQEEPVPAGSCLLGRRRAVRREPRGPDLDPRGRGQGHQRAGGQRRAEARLVLPRVHGRSRDREGRHRARSTRCWPASTASRRSRAGRRDREAARGRRQRRPHVRLGRRHQGLIEADRVDSAWAAPACPTATTTSTKARASRRSARPTAPTSRRSW